MNEIIFFHTFLYFCKRMRNQLDILPLDHLFLNIKKRDEFDF